MHKASMISSKQQDPCLESSQSNDLFISKPKFMQSYHISYEGICHADQIPVGIGSGNQCSSFDKYWEQASPHISPGWDKKALPS